MFDACLWRQNDQFGQLKSMQCRLIKEFFQEIEHSIMGHLDELF